VTSSTWLGYLWVRVPASKGISAGVLAVRQGQHRLTRMRGIGAMLSGASSVQAGRCWFGCLLGAGHLLNRPQIGASNTTLVSDSAYATRPTDMCPTTGRMGRRVTGTFDEKEGACG
jgi:hypothetical protein